MTFLVQPAAGDHSLGSEHVSHGLRERLAAVEHEQDALADVEAAVAQVRDQAAHHGRVLGRSLDHPERHLRPVGGDAERADHGVAGEVEPVDEHDQPPLARRADASGTRPAAPPSR